MHISDFNFELPPELIAREPARPRDASRMLVLNRATGRLVDSMFRQLPEYLRPSDVVVLNDTRVIRARIRGKLERNGGTSREIEVLFAAPIGPDTWEVLCRPGKRVAVGDRIIFGNGDVEGEFGERREHGVRLLQLSRSSSSSLEEFLDAHGRVPLPPYLRREDQPADSVEYQTVYANRRGAIAAPTAGLHFTEAVLDKLQERGIEIVKITLHVGIGTFIPVRTDDPRRHSLKPERFEISQEAASSLNEARVSGRRIIAVGTTTTRTLEFIFQQCGSFQGTSGEADLFILPGYQFNAVDVMLTNFHLPKSTLLMMVSAFASRDSILDAYRHAVQNQYRFYSYGDCMLIE
jgi:S-adenosylmethionine:tRNA ribosyltransferase-isomerase